MAFIRHAKGTAMLVWGVVLHLPLLLLMKLKLYPNGKAKQRLFSFFFKGISAQEFTDTCESFARTHQHLLHPQGIRQIEEALSRGEQVLIVSASIADWVAPFFHRDAHLMVLGTQIETVDGVVTGRFLTENCYGAEKVNRIQQVLTDRADCYLIAYGDSRGDKEMLEYADEAHYKPFR